MRGILREALSKSQAKLPNMKTYLGDAKDVLTPTKATVNKLLHGFAANSSTPFESR